MPTILVTRPEPHDETMDRLRALGYQTLSSPLLRIIPTHAPIPALRLYQAILLTSPKAVGFDWPNIPQHQIPQQDLRSLPCLCVGDRTAAAARAKGFTHVISASGDGHDLIDLLRQTFAPEKGSLLHICGEHRTVHHTDILQTLGYAVIPWAIYRAQQATDLSPDTLHALQAGQVDAVLLYSARTAEALRTILNQHAELQHCCSTVVALGLSQTIIDVLSGTAWRHLAAAPAPTEDDLLQTLLRLCPP